jgi:hypothetical protein
LVFELTIPFPDTMLEWAWFCIGITFGRSFGKRLDQDIQESDWFKTLNPGVQWILKRSLDFLHHWWMGALLVIYAYKLPQAQVEAAWFGWGLLISDLPDIPRRYGSRR